MQIIGNRNRDRSLVEYYVELTLSQCHSSGCRYHLPADSVSAQGPEEADGNRSRLRT